MENKYYIYCYYDKDWIPFYIGMGHNNRMLDRLKIRKNNNIKHLFFYKKLNNIIENNEEFHCKIIRSKLTRKEACVVEQVLIECIGRRDLNIGPLSNLTYGGDGRFIDGNTTAIYDKDSLKLVRTFRSRKDAAAFLNVKPASVATAERDYSKTGIPNKYYALSCKDGDIPDDFKYKTKEQAIKVSALNLENNKLISFKSIKECARYFNVDKTTITNRLNNNITTRIRRPDLNKWKFLYD